MAASRSAAARNHAAAKTISHDSVDFEAGATPRELDAALREAVRYNHSPEQRLERATRKAYVEHLEMEERKARSDFANNCKTKDVEARRSKIAEIWPEVWKAQPRNPGKRYNLLKDRLEEEGYAISVDTLVQRDLPALDRAGKLVPPRKRIA